MFVEAFSRFRGGVGFLYALIAVLLGWFSWNFCPYLPHFDRPAGGDAWLLLNLCLSIEASFAMPVLLMAADKRANEEKAKLREVLAATQELLRRMGDVQEDVEEIAEDVEHLMVEDA